MKILAIDPGNEMSAFVRYDAAAHAVQSAGKHDNVFLLERLAGLALGCDVVAIEMIASYGMPVGREVFETCVWIGRFAQLLVGVGKPFPMLVYRRDVKMHLCGTARAKDANIHQALADLFGGKNCKGTKKAPGPLYGFKADMWAALGVAVTVAHREAAHVQS
jgi:hypothetical protein